MTESEFNVQINRLADTFGANHYRGDRARILWRDVQSFTGEWLAGVVDGLIRTSRFAPLPQDFAEAISIERERLWRLQKEQGRQEAQDFFSGRFLPEDKRMICQMILRRMRGGVPDDEWEQFMTMLNGASA